MLYYFLAKLQSVLHFFNVVESRLVLTLRYDFLNLVINGVQLWDVDRLGETCLVSYCSSMFLCVVWQSKIKHLHKMVISVCFLFCQVMQMILCTLKCKTYLHFHNVSWQLVHKILQLPCISFPAWRVHVQRSASRRLGRCRTLPTCERFSPLGQNYLDPNKSSSAASELADIYNVVKQTI